VAASTLVAEVAMQIIGSVYMGLATQYARKQKFYRIGMLTGVPRGKDALVMYAGSLLWLTVIAFAILACLSSVLGVSQYVASLGQLIKGASRKAHKQRKRCETTMTRLLRAKQKAVNFEALHRESLRQTYQNQPKSSDEYEELIRCWRETTRMGRRLVGYIDKDQPEFHKEEMKMEKLRKRRDKINARGQRHQYPALMTEARRSIADFEQSRNYMNSLPPQELETIQNVNWISEALERVRIMRSTTVLNFEYAQEDDMAMITPPTAALNVLAHEMETLKNLWVKLESVLEALSKAWAEQHRARQQEEAKRHEDPTSRLRKMAARTVVGMIGCWIAQWIWWIGYIRVSGDAYVTLLGLTVDMIF
jgi:predicted TIM-barrel fold metal-dependent hydrolase